MTEDLHTPKGGDLQLRVETAKFSALLATAIAFRGWKRGLYIRFLHCRIRLSRISLQFSLCLLIGVMCLCLQYFLHKRFKNKSE